MFIPPLRTIRRDGLCSLLAFGFLLTACGAEAPPTVAPTSTVPVATATTLTLTNTVVPITVTSAPATATTAPATATGVPPTATAAAQAAATPTRTAGPGIVAVREFDFDFGPKVITIPVGTKVVWTNEGPTDHTVADKDVTWSSEILHKGDSYSHVFSAPGTVTVICTLHPDMVSTVIVK